MKAIGRRIQERNKQSNKKEVNRDRKASNQY